VSKAMLSGRHGSIVAKLCQSKGPDSARLGRCYTYGMVQWELRLG
jgi:hypothetical protein